MAVEVNPSVQACLAVNHLNVQYRTPAGLTKAVRDVSLRVMRGEIVGIAGESGCGKSTLAHAISGLLRPSARISGGEVWLNGQNLVPMSERQLRHVRWKQVSIVPQSAMNNLSPVLRVGEQIADAILAHESMSRGAAWDRARELLQMVHIDPRRTSSFPHELSGGMRQRVVIAMALALHPDLLILDEPTTALDVVVQAAILSEVKRIQQEMGFSAVFITHDLPLLLQIADRIAVMYAGKIVETAFSATFAKAARHPYSQLLLKAFPPLFGEMRRAQAIAGMPPDLRATVTGCAFSERCPQVMAACFAHEPPTVHARDGEVACHLYGEANGHGED